MGYQVSARKWRPQTFAELVGQEHIVRTLTNAIRLGRVSHAYLFSGTRGVGKTTTARIFAKALNCVDGPTPDPCGHCGFCEEIREGRCLDVYEIDGASNTGVAEVRDIIDNVSYAASACNYKVYIIDEVHMLSKSAFNALLKTLEEPPEKVVFIFATTEQRKIPETILSRCQSFDFKPLSQKQIVQQMRAICDHEGIRADNLSLEEIAKTGAGSMRDAQSLLDQVVAFCGKEIHHGDVESVLGIAGQTTLETFIDRLIGRDAGALLGLVQELINNGKDLNFFCRDLIEYFRNLLFVAVTEAPETLLNPSACDLETLQRQAGAFHKDELQQMFNVVARAEAEMKRSSLPQMVFEMAVVRLTDVRPFRDLDQLIDRVNTLSGPGPEETPPLTGIGADASQMPPITSQARAWSPSAGSTPLTGEGRFAPPAAGERSGPNPPGPPAGAPRPGGWREVREAICASKPQFQHYLGHGRLVELTDTVLHLEFPDQFTLDIVERKENREVILQAVKNVLGHELEVRLTIQTDRSGMADPAAKIEEKSGREDYNVTRQTKNRTEAEIIQDALDVFGGIVIR